MPNFVVTRQGSHARTAAIYGIWLFVAWTLYVAFLYPMLPTKTSIVAKTLHECIRIGIFTIPILLLLRSRSPWTELRLIPLTVRDATIGLVVGVAWLALAILLDLTLQHKSLIRIPSPYFLLTGFSIAVVVEELTFRSYFLHVVKPHGNGIAIIVSSLLFVLIHYPGWYLHGMLPTVSAWISLSISIFFLGCVLALLCLKTTSIWPCIFIHACNNLAAAFTVNAG